ncbi:hypothetical protein [Williamsia sp. DF01-3]|uniref:hypothetical protein n=1 Tax=Williamsia sp. DF01-3 TaxID=2934157 RepID=UPI001FF2B435|nr:hypothetical protein [Williamsia sp. DF01-3]MCK0517883.1 hypothetical protein [Williamsia sp. DF01-3]
MAAMALMGLDPKADRIEQLTLTRDCSMLTCFTQAPDGQLVAENDRLVRHTVTIPIAGDDEQIDPGTPIFDELQSETNPRPLPSGGQLLKMGPRPEISR